MASKQQIDRIARRIEALKHCALIAKPSVSFDQIPLGTRGNGSTCHLPPSVCVRNSRMVQDPICACPR